MVCLACKLYAGVFGSRDPQKELEKVSEVVSALRILDLNHGASLRYGELVESMRKSPIGDFDLMIACIAMEFGESLATRNTELFRRVEGLQLDAR